MLLSHTIFSIHLVVGRKGHDPQRRTHCALARAAWFWSVEMDPPQTAVPVTVFEGFENE